MSNIPKTIRSMFEICYLDSMTTDIESLIIDLNPYEYSYILHDKDVYPSGELKKPHYHIYCKWLVPQQHDNIVKRLGWNDRHRLTTARSKSACHQYMLHITAQCKRENKVEYPKTAIKSNIENIKDLLVINRELHYNKFTQIYNLISQLDSYQLTLRKFYIILNDLDLLEFFNKYYNCCFSRILPKSAILKDRNDSKKDLDVN